MPSEAVGTPDLSRSLGAVDATAIVVGIVIGSGIFVFPNLIARDLPSGPAIIAAWVISGVLSLIGALAFAELGTMMPRTGGQYVYLHEAYGPLCAFVCGWTFTLAALAGSTAWLAVTFSIYAGYFVHVGAASSKLIAVGLIALLSAVNYVGVRQSAWVQRTFTVLKVAALLALIAAAFALSPAHSTAPPASHRPISLAHFGAGMAACLMAYNGWGYVTFVAGEVRDPRRNLLRALFTGMAVVIALYVLANLAYLTALTIPEIASSERVGADLATRTMGPIGGTFVSVAVLLSIVGAVNGCILTGARLPFAQARDGLFFAHFARVHPRFRTPAAAVFWTGLWTAFLVLTGSYETLYSYSILAAWIFYTLTVGAVLVLRRKLPDAPRPYRMWGYPFTLWVFLVVSVWFIANAFVTETVPALMTLAIIATGVLGFAIWSRIAPGARVVHGTTVVAEKVG